MSLMASVAKNAAHCVIVLLLFSIRSSAVTGCARIDEVRTDKAAPSSGGVEYLRLSNVTGVCGGTLVTSRRAEARTLNPLVAMDGTSRELIGLLMADLIHINRYTQQTEPALASSWQTSQDGRVFTVNLRRGVRFSDGHLFDADDVLFTFRAYLDEKVHSPQRDLLVVGGIPMAIRKTGPYTVVFTFAQPYSAAERLFDSIAILPKHMLEGIYGENKLAGAWTVGTPANQFAGLGPFQIQQYSPGQRIILERNPFYWKTDAKGNRLPYLDRIVSVVTPTPEAEELGFEAGKFDV